MTGLPNFKVYGLVLHLLQLLWSHSVLFLFVVMTLHIKLTASLALLLTTQSLKYAVHLNMLFTLMEA